MAVRYLFDQLDFDKKVEFLEDLYYSDWNQICCVCKEVVERNKTIICDNCKSLLHKKCNNNFCWNCDDELDGDYCENCIDFLNENLCEKCINL